jgi:NAD-dependent DNA ligase
MEKIKDIIEEYQVTGTLNSFQKKQLLDFLDKHYTILVVAAEKYYTTDSISLTDKEFDELCVIFKKALEIVNHECSEKLNYDINKFSMIPSEIPQKIGKKERHLFNGLLGTLNKCNTIAEVQDWYNKIKLENHVDSLDILWSLKYDGNSCYIVYNENGEAINAFTRGKDGYGLNITVFKDHQILPIKIPDNSLIAVRYEVIMTDENFIKMTNDENINYTSNRSIVAGILNRKDGVTY